MCLMCEWYIDFCTEKECFEKSVGEEKYMFRPIHTEEREARGEPPGMFLWMGHTDPCEHIKARHDPDCGVFVPEDRCCDCN